MLNEELIYDEAFAEKVNAARRANTKVIFLISMLVMWFLSRKFRNNSQKKKQAPEGTCFKTYSGRSSLRRVPVGLT